MYCVNCGTPSSTPLCGSCLSKVVPVEYPICARCGRTVERGFKVCEYCRGKEEKYARHFIGYRYYGPVVSLLRRWKFGRDGFCEELILSMFEEFVLAFKEEFREVEAVCSVPTHYRRWLTRGFNQSEVLALFVGELLNKPVVTRAFARVKGDGVSGARSSLEREERAESSYVYTGVKLPSVVLLVDDVFTSGATMGKLSSLAKECGGVEKVFVLTFAGGGVGKNARAGVGRTG